jgi:hypothetical protein
VAVFAVSAADAEVQAPNQNRSLGAIVGPTAARLAELQAEGNEGPFFVTWFPDGWTIGAQGYGLLNELLRRDFDVRAHIANRPGSTRYHVMDPDAATIEVHVATGRDIQRWQTDASYEEITYFDPRTDAERAEFEDLRTQVINDLEAIGRDDFARAVDENLFSLGIEPRVPEAIRDRISRMIDLGMPTAVFLGPPSGTA